MPDPAHPASPARRQPQQRRSRLLVASIREACLRILQEAGGPERLTAKHLRAARTPDGAAWRDLPPLPPRDRLPRAGKGQRRALQRGDELGRLGAHAARGAPRDDRDGVPRHRSLRRCRHDHRHERARSTCIPGGSRRHGSAPSCWHCCCATCASTAPKQTTDTSPGEPRCPRIRRIPR